MELQRAPYLKYLKRKSDMDKFVERRRAVFVETKCFDCGAELEARMDNGDGKTRCVKCSTDKYKADCSLTYGLTINRMCWFGGL